jgi:hypothetical protein
MYTLYPEDSSLIDEHWFETQLGRYKQNAYEACYGKEVAALRAFYNGESSIEEAATAITRPISNSPVQDLGGYSDEIVAICQLWCLLRNALIEWPHSRTADLVALLLAMTKVTDLIHGGELLDDENEKPVSWAAHPFLHMVWSDAFWRTPGQVARQATDASSRQHERKVYIKQQDVEARLVAAGIFDCKQSWTSPIGLRTLYSLYAGYRAPRYMIWTLERAPGPEDIEDADNDGDAEFQLKLEFQIPAASKWIEHNVQKLYDTLGELEDWNKRKTHGFEMKQFDRPLDRWEFWQKRYVVLAHGPVALIRCLFELIACFFLGYSTLQKMLGSMLLHEMQRRSLYSICG